MRGFRWLWVVALAIVALAGAAPDAEARGKRVKLCKRQLPQTFLVRSSFVKRGQIEPEAHKRALKWRIRTYGHVPGVPWEKLHPKPASSFATKTSFMGRALSVHEKIVEPLGCVEKRIAITCRDPDEQYEARAVGGFRSENSYRGGEVSNHLFGIAVDIDPEQNPCCKCVEPWPDNPRCKKKTIWQRTSLPKCWVDAFESQGFYWLGKDALEDTMHFEYLGRPR